MADGKTIYGSQESDEYWSAVGEGRLLLQRCSNCGTAQFYPRVFSLACGRRDLSWVEASGNATLHAFSIVHQAPTRDFAGDTPYVTAIVELEEGPRMPTRIVGTDPDPSALEIGQALELTFAEVGGRRLPVFRPAGSA